MQHPRNNVHGADECDLWPKEIQDWVICVRRCVDSNGLDGANIRRYAPECPVAAPGGCSLSVTANAPCQGLSSACTYGRHIHEAVAAAIGRGGRVGERVDVWTLRVMSIAVEALPADVPDNRPSGLFT